MSRFAFNCVRANTPSIPRGSGTQPTSKGTPQCCSSPRAWARHIDRVIRNRLRVALQTRLCQRRAYFSRERRPTAPFSSSSLRGFGGRFANDTRWPRIDSRTARSIRGCRPSGAPSPRDLPNQLGLLRYAVANAEEHVDLVVDHDQNAGPWLRASEVPARCSSYAARRRVVGVPRARFSFHSRYNARNSRPRNRCSSANGAKHYAGQNQPKPVVWLNQRVSFVACEARATQPLGPSVALARRQAPVCHRTPAVLPTSLLPNCTYSLRACVMPCTRSRLRRHCERLRSACA